MFGGTFDIEVHSVGAGCQIPVGYKSSVFVGTISIGRESDADFDLHDETISRQHVTIALSEQGFVVQNTSQHGTTCLNGRTLAANENATSSAEEMWLQIGRVLLLIKVTPTTIPADMLLPIPGALGYTQSLPLLRLRRFHDRWELWLQSQPTRLFPTATRVLARLCQTPGVVVTHYDLAEASDPENFPRQGSTSVPQLITFIRNAFDEAMQAALIDEKKLHDLVFKNEAHPPAFEDRRRLLRNLIENVRGMGYRLRLPPSEIELS